MIENECNSDGQEFEVRLYCEHPDGDPVQLTSFVDLSNFGGVCPDVGDILATWYLGTPYAYMLVEKRYFVAQQNGPRGWAIFVRELQPSPFDKRVVAQWSKDTEDFQQPEDDELLPPECEPVPPPPYRKSKRASHKIKDPDYWTPERKEALRKKREAKATLRAKN